MPNESPPENELKESIEHLDKNVEKLDTDINKLSSGFRYGPTFGRGIIGAVGAVIGTTILLTIVIYLLQKLAGIPIFGDEFRFFLDKLQQR
jgi:tetrahydromethanopterin S-methyltransferase subunit G